MMPARLIPMSLFFLVFLGVLNSKGTPLFGQKVLQMEKSGSLKTKKFYLGDEITYSLRSEPKDFQTAEIREIIVNEQIVQLGPRLINIQDIAALRSYRPGKIGKSLSNQMYTFAAGWSLFSIGGLFANRDIINTDYYIVGTALVSGWLIRKLVKKRTYRMKGRNRLRILDLNFREQPF